MRSGTRRKLVSNSAWTVGGYGARQGFRVASNLVLTRLLEPHAFGLMLIVNTIVRGIRMLSDIGLGPCIVRDERGEEIPFLNTAWSIQIVRGWILWGIVCLLAVPLSWLYDEPMLASLLPVVGFSSGILGLQSVSRYVAHRRQQIPRLIVFELTAQLVMLGGMIALAFVLRSVWALAFGTLIGALMQTVLSYVMLGKHPHRIQWERDASRVLLYFGRWILVSTAFAFFASNGDRLLLGKLVSFEVLGVFGIALTFVQVVRAIVSQIEGKVILPAISGLQTMPRPDLQRRLSAAKGKALLWGAPIIAAMVAFSDPLIKFMFPEKFHEAGWMASILALSLWVRIGTAAYGPLVIALGWPKAMAAANACQGIFLLLAVPIGYAAYGLTGALVAMACVELPGYAVLNHVLAKERLTGLCRDALHTVVFAGWVLALDGVRRLLLG